MRKINKDEMALAYVQMGAINLEMSEAYFHLETEGEQVNEVGSTKGKERAKQA